MNSLFSGACNKNSIGRELVATFRSTLDKKYQQVLRGAEARWERDFAGKDPSDACVSVRISGFTAHDFLKVA
jgi:hypothetical protein